MTRFDSYYSGFTKNYAYPRVLRSYKTGAFPDALVFHEGKKLIDFSSNDYLGLAKHPYLIARSHDFAKRWGTGSSSSRLVRGNLAIFDTLETDLAKALGKEATLILGTGFQANATILEALLDVDVLGSEPLVFCDKASHASLYAGLSKLKRFYRFRHNDLDDLKRLLDQQATSTQPKFIIAESVYSMDGDLADLNQLSALAEQYQALLYIDDAHALGIYGPSGFGKATEENCKVDLIVGTFSKAMGSFGAYLACSQDFRHYLLHRCKGLIYSTALSPPVLGAISAAMELVPSMHEQRQKVLHYSDLIRTFFDEQGLSYGNASSHLIPWIIGCAEKTRLASQLLEEHGILGAPIQTPTVPLRKNRIRFCVSALHTENDLNLLFSSIQKVKNKLNI